MGYFDALVEGAFKKNALGNTVFYPWGVLGSGFVVPTDEDRTRIRAFYARWMSVSFVTLLGMQFLAGPWFSLAAIPFYGISYYFAVKRMTSDLLITNERLGVAESYRNSARAHNLATLVLFEFFAFVCVVGGLFLLAIKQDQLIALFSIAFFGLSGIAIGYMIFAKFSNR